MDMSQRPGALDLQNLRRCSGRSRSRVATIRGHRIDDAPFSSAAIVLKLNSFIGIWYAVVRTLPNDSINIHYAYYLALTLTRCPPKLHVFH